MDKRQRDERMRREAALEAMRVNPNPRIVALLDYALDGVLDRLHGREKYPDWLAWAGSWKSGQRCPGSCVEVAHKCFADKDNMIGHALGQLAWAGKEACYSNPKSGWLVIRYIADAMLFFNVAFPEKLALEPPAPTLEYLSADSP